LFLWVHFLDCHVPYRHATDTGLPRAVRVALSGGDAVEMARAGELDKETGWAAYNNELEHVDVAVNRILDQLAASTRRRIVAFTSDHGEEIFDHGGFEHGHTLYDELVRVPLVVTGLQRRRPGSIEGEPVSIGDLSPTLLSAADLPTQGQNLDYPIQRRLLLSWNLLYGHPDQNAVRDGPWKLIARNNGKGRLFNLADDPGETRDQAATRPDLVARLAKPPVVPPRSEAKALTPAQENALRMLGYLEER
jgi:arylsulfatase A-like enzyme